MQVTLYDAVRLNLDSASAALSVGDRTFLNSGTQVFCRRSVSIGSDSAIGPGCMIFDNNMHAIDGSREATPVVIGNNAWLAANVVVLPGVTIGDGAIVGAGSVVTRDIPPGMLALGNPARVVREATWER